MYANLIQLIDMDLRHEEKWRSGAECLDVDPVIFYPTDENGHEDYSPDAIEKAQTICMDCPVKIECLRYVLRKGVDLSLSVGVWAGTTPDGRAKLRRHRPVKAVAAQVGDILGINMTDVLAAKAA